jgi:hypothetical protein
MGTTLIGDLRYGPTSHLPRGVARDDHPATQLVHPFRQVEGSHARDASTVRGLALEPVGSLRRTAPSTAVSCPAAGPRPAARQRRFHGPGCLVNDFETRGEERVVEGVRAAQNHARHTRNSFCIAVELDLLAVESAKAHRLPGADVIAAGIHEEHVERDDAFSVVRDVEACQFAGSEKYRPEREARS